MSALTPQDLQSARAMAEHSGRPLLEVLADEKQGDSYEMLAALSGMFGYPVIDSNRMASLTPAFDLLDYTCLLYTSDAADD